MCANVRVARTTGPILGVVDQADTADRRVMGRLRFAWKVLLVCAGYYAGAIVGISFGFPPSGISTIWPPSAILLAALLLEAPRVWWVYLLAALPTHLLVVAQFQDTVPFAVKLSQFIGNAVQVILGAAAVRAAAGGPPRFDSLRGMTEFILLAPSPRRSWRVRRRSACSRRSAGPRISGWRGGSGSSRMDSRS